MRSYRVAITYREPSFEARRGWGERLYSAAFVVRAGTRHAAIARATDAFEQIAAKSGVSWPREIVGVQAQRLGGALPELLDGSAA